MSYKPFFSIIIPTYNRANLLKKAIDSVLTQIYENWELIIIDDGSTDNTQRVVTDYKDSRIKYYYQEHGERSSARNRGIREASGMYVCFLDDDDFFLDHHLTTFKKAILEQQQPVAIFRTGMIIDGHGKQKKSLFYQSEKDKNSILFFLENMVGIHTLCFHQIILEKYKFDSRWIHFQDTHHFIRCMLDYPFFQIQEYTCIYNLHDQMGSRKAFQDPDSEARTENNIAAIRDLFQLGGERFLAYVPHYFENKMVCLKYLQHANGALRVGKRELAWKHFKKSIAQNKFFWFKKSYTKFVIKFCVTSVFKPGRLFK